MSHSLAGDSDYYDYDYDYDYYDDLLSKINGKLQVIQTLQKSINEGGKTPIDYRNFGLYVIKEQKVAYTELGKGNVDNAISILVHLHNYLDKEHTNLVDLSINNGLVGFDVY